MAASEAAAAPASQLVGAKIIPFPVFPEAARPVNNDMARSALFSCVQGKNRRMLKNAAVATVGDVRIEFSGEQWNQDDHDVLMQLVFMACDKPFGQLVSVSSYAVLAGLGRMQGGRQHEHLRQEIERLTKGSVTLRSKDVNYTGHFIEESLQDLQTRQWLYRFNANMQAFFRLDNYTLIDWERRKNLKRKDLARWLQLYWSTHSKPFPVSIEYLRQNWLQVFERGETACRRHGAGHEGHRSVVQSEQCLRLWASIRDGDGVITGFFGPCAADVLTAHVAVFSC